MKKHDIHVIIARMDIHTLRTLVAVSRLGSFAAVAREDNSDPSAVSRAVKAAESELGARLFQRSTRRLSVTSAGRAFLSAAEDMVASFDRAVEEVRGTGARLAGPVRFTASVAFTQCCLLPLLDAFQKKYPEIELELIADDSNLDLIREGIDLAIRLAPEIHGDLICSKLRTTCYGVYVSPSFLEKNPPLLHPSDLQAVPVVSFNLPGFRDCWRYRKKGGKPQTVDVSGTLRFSSALAVKDAVIRGLGPGLLADWVATDATAEGRLIEVFPDHRFTATTFDTAAWLVYQERRHLPARVRETIDFLRANLKEPDQ